MAKFRKKPVVIDAVPWRGANIDEVRETLIRVDDEWDCRLVVEGEKLQIATREGTMTADVGDWVIRGVQGELYPCKPDIFNATYNPA